MSRTGIAILGSGPTGLEAALAAVEGGHSFTLYEAADRPAAHVAAWGHVRLFSPWGLDVSPRMRRRLEAAGHAVPDGEECPTGAELWRRVLEPVARLPEIEPRLRLGARVVAVGREGLLKHEAIGSAERAARPFRLLVRDAAGRETIEHAEVVVDCTGTYGCPNALGDGGIPAPGEEALGEEIVRSIPDVAGEPRPWAGKTVLLAGAGHSAQTVALELAALARRHPGTRLLWVLRSESPGWEADPQDPLPERRRLIEAATALVAGAEPAVEALAGCVVDGLERAGDRFAETLRTADGGRRTETVDRVVSLTGYVPDASLYRQLQFHECYATSGPMKLAAALLGSAGGDCLAQESHGAETLRSPEPGFFVLGSKSYGRNTTFLMRVGWQQVDEVMSLIAPAVAGAGV